MITQLNNSTINILIVEDDEDYAQYTRIILSKVSNIYEFYIAHAIKPAIEILSEKQIDVVLCDLGLPDGQGLGIVSSIKLANENVPILLLTNLDDDELGIQAINRGASDYISKKNVAPELLHRMIIHSIERNKILNQLEEQKGQLLRMQKMEALVTLVGGISHDFNNIITLIKGYSELIENHPDTTDKIAKYNRNVIDASERAGNLIDQLSTFSREETRKTEIVDVNEAIKSLMELIQNIIREDVELELDFTDEPVLISINSTNFEQIILNLILNAREAIDSTGKIIIRTRSNFVCQDCDILENSVNISIQDTGSGIKRNLLPNIFDPYFTTKPQGSGLGLATVYGLVNQVNGCINVDSTVGIGTTMNLCFIKSNEIELENISKLGQPVDLKNANIKLILIIDDDKEILDLLQSMLQSEDYSIKTMVNPLNAIEQIFSGSINPSVILTDVIMPKMSGIKFAKKIHAKYPDLPIMLMSGYSPQYYEDPNSHQLKLIRKPFSKDVLLQSLAEVIQQD